MFFFFFIPSNPNSPYPIPCVMRLTPSSGVPVVQSTTDSAESGQKRSRDDESAAQPPAKKVDAKE